MKFEILNVEHGFAAYALANDGSVLLFDCGHAPTCRPSDYLSAQGIRTIRRLFITHYDEDHIGDLPNVCRSLSVEVLTRNPSLTSAQLRSLKPPPISAAMKVLLAMIDSYTGDVSNERLEPSGIRVCTFYNTYPTIADTNNLSLLTFLNVGPVSFVLPAISSVPAGLRYSLIHRFANCWNMSMFSLPHITVVRVAIAVRSSTIVDHR